ncbi:hypothetical protein [Persephonella sp. KM09-Lau-8]|uniref:hypothetical protein n=1 Tax=Persephonella sp. KM09-Lau-8 TaxID=1158345 RepID=UPI00068FD920|nr:hypothetical protein [Persephonella sp. KM09-Lau-8]
MDFLDFENELKDQIIRLNQLISNTDSLSGQISKTNSDIKNLKDKVDHLYKKIGKNNPYEANFNFGTNPEINSLNNLIDENLIEKVEKDISKEVSRKVKMPELSLLDILVVGTAGVIASAIDILIVKIPKDINYLYKFQQEGSSLTKWLRNLGVDEDGNLSPFLKSLEERAKVPYDMSINPGGLNNFYPGNHRMLSLGHDPLFGLIFGVIDILNGQVSVIDGKGIPHVISTFDLPTQDKIFAPVIWLLHIISDICTSRGIPIPGWGFTQLLQIGEFGEKNRTIAELTRWMYENGYDLRHFLTMSTVPAVIEIIVRLYHILSIDKIDKSLPLSQKEIIKIRNDIKLTKMLFYAHSIASAGNVVKIAFYHGNPMAINISQWLMLFKRGVEFTKVALRNDNYEKIVRNREKINKKWEELENY